MIKGVFWWKGELFLIGGREQQGRFGFECSKGNLVH